MISNGEYIGFDIKALFFYLLHKWRLLVSVAVAAAVVCGTVGMGSNAQTNREKYAEYVKEIEYSMDCVDAAQQKVDSMIEYTGKSVLMNTDYQNVYVSKLSFYIDSGYKILSDSYYQDTDKTAVLISNYIKCLDDAGIYSDIAAELGTEPKYIYELVTVSADSDKMLNISVWHPRQDCAEKIAETACEKVMAEYARINEAVAQHNISLVSSSCGQYIDNDLLDAQQKVGDNMAEAEKELTKREEALTALKGNAMYSIYKNGGKPADNRAKNFVKWFALGGIAGTVAAAGILLVYSVCRKLMHSAAQLRASFDIKVAGQAVCSTGKLSAIDRLISKAEGWPVQTEERDWQYIAQILRQENPASENILVCTDTSTALNTAVAQALAGFMQGVNIIPAGNLFTDAAALSQLAECDSLIIVAQRDKSTDSGIRKLLDLAKLYGKETAGCIIAN